MPFGHRGLEEIAMGWIVDLPGIERSAVPALAACALLLSACGGGDGSEEHNQSQAFCNEPTRLCTYAGNGEAGFDGDGYPLSDSSFYWPIDLTITRSGDVYVLDWNNHAVRRVQSDNTL